MNSLESAVAATSFDQATAPLAKAKAKLKKESHVLQKEAKHFANNASRKAPREAAQVKEARDIEEPLRFDLKIEKATIEFKKGC